MANVRYLTQNDANIAIDPVSGNYMSSTGQPTQSYALSLNTPVAVIGFKVPQGVVMKIDAYPVIQATFMAAATGNTQINPGDFILFYSKSPSGERFTLGTLLGYTSYRPYWEIASSSQVMGQYAQRLQFPLTSNYALPQNYILYVAIASTVGSETVYWSNPGTLISIPVRFETMLS
ncbi:MAG: hypothetical protein QXP36_04060 [Conexivisphaerales archaeon]